MSQTTGRPSRRPFFRRRKSCPFSGPNAQKIDYKNTKLLHLGITSRLFRNTGVA